MCAISHGVWVKGLIAALSRRRLTLGDSNEEDMELDWWALRWIALWWRCTVCSQASRFSWKWREKGCDLCEGGNVVLYCLELQLGRLGIAGPVNRSQGWPSKRITSDLGSLVGNSDNQCWRTSLSWRKVRSWRCQFQSVDSRTCICYPSLRIKGANHSLLTLHIQTGHRLLSKHWHLSPDDRHHAQGEAQEVVHFLLQLRRIVLLSHYDRHLACFAFDA